MSETHRDPSSAPDPSDAAARARARVVQIGRVQIAVNVILQTLLVLALVFLANFLSYRNHKPIDWSGTGRFTLSPQTLAVLKQIQEPCQITIYFSSPGQVYDDTVSLLREYEAQSDHRVSVELVNPRITPNRAKELIAKYKFGNSEDIVILDYKGQSKWVDSREFAEVIPLPPEKQDARSGEVARVKSYKGEQFITAALMELIEGKTNKLYVVNGHGELCLGVPDFDVARHYLEGQNLKLENLLLSAADKVPEDATGLLIAGPSQDFSERDVALLSDYWKRNGRVFVAVGPRSKVPNLEKWIADRGILLHHDAVMSKSKRLVEDVVEKTEIRPAVGVFLSGARMVFGAEGQTVLFPDFPQSCEPVLQMVQSGQITATPLLMAPPQFWGETDPKLLEADPGARPQNLPNPEYDPKTDYPRLDEKHPDKKPEPLILACAVEKGAPRDPTVKLQTPRLVVVGSGDFLDNSTMVQGGEAKNLLVLPTNWILNREAFIQVPPKEKVLNDVSLTDEQVAKLGWIVILGLPICFGTFGLYYLTWRHSRNLITVTAVVLSVLLIIWGAVLGIQSWAERTRRASDSPELPFAPR